MDNGLLTMQPSSFPTGIAQHIEMCYQQYYTERQLTFVDPTERQLLLCFSYLSHFNNKHQKINK